MKNSKINSKIYVLLLITKKSTEIRFFENRGIKRKRKKTTKTKNDYIWKKEEEKKNNETCRRKRQQEDKINLKNQTL